MTSWPERVHSLPALVLALMLVAGLGTAQEPVPRSIANLGFEPLAADGGYAFALSERWAFVLSGQIGYSWFSKKERGSDPHIGIYPSIGLWL